MTRRNNLERTGAPHIDSAPMAETHNTEAPELDPLSFIVPTEFVTLPSRGAYYPETHPLHGEESLEIKYMTAKEEDLLTSKGLLEKGLVLDRLIDSLLVNKKIRSRDLLTSDRNAILVQARISGYGSDYATTIVCSSCGEGDKYHYDLQEAEVKDPRNSEDLQDAGVEHLEGATFKVTVPNSPVHLNVRLLNGHDERAILDSQRQRRKKKQEDRLVTDQLNSMIVSVMDHTDRQIIGKYVDSLPLHESRYLRKTYEEIAPSVTLRKEFVCNHCGYEDEITFPFTTDFFWPDV